MDLAKMKQEMVALLSEYGVDRAGIDSAIDLAIAYGENEYSNGWQDATNKIAEG